MRLSVLSAVILMPVMLSAATGIKEGRDAYLQGDFQAHFNSLVSAIMAEPESARSAAILDSLVELRGSVTNFPVITNACKLFIASSNGINRFNGLRSMGMELIKNGQTVRGKGFLERTGMISTWKMVGPYAGSGRSDIDTVFEFEKKGFSFSERYSNSSGPMLPVDVEAFTPEGWNAPSYYYGSANGTVYLVS